MTENDKRISRRTLLGASALGVVAVGGGTTALLWPDKSAPAANLVMPTSTAVAAVEKARPSTGKLVVANLTPRPTTVDLGGKIVNTWTYDGTLPGKPIRVTTGDRLMATVTNKVTDPTTIHWHGLALRNDMDGVPGLTQSSIAPQAQHVYDFTVPEPGTFWFHPHYGVQLDTGLYAPLIIEDPQEPGSYDDEVVLVLDDWTDGWSTAPDDVLAGFQSNGMTSMTGMDMGSMSSTVSAEDPLGTDTGDVVYPAHLINGKLPTDAYTIRTQAKKRLRIRVINAGSDTAYRLAIGGHQLTVTHSDGYPVTPVTVETLIIGMGERYDLLIDVADGTHPIVAKPEGKTDPQAVAVITTATGKIPSPSPAAIPTELAGRLLTYDDLTATDAVALAANDPDREIAMSLTMGDGGRQWLINGRTYDDTQPVEVQQGERVRLTFDNQSTMFHPMHLHGHTYAVTRADGRGPRKDTLNVLPMSKVAVDFDAINPGQWLTHCHNTYHGELGMMTVLSYVTT